MYLHLRKHYYSAFIVIAFLVLVGGVFYFGSRKSAPEIVSRTTVDTTATSTGEETGKPELETIPPEEDIKRLPPPYTGQPIRELGNPDILASIGAAYVERYQKDLNSIANRIEKGSRDHVDWLTVAYIKKLFSNYIGTRDAWEYAKIVNPEDAVAYFNLGELYGYEFKEPAKAEENYLSALRLNPYHLDYYIGLANFYEDVPKDLKKAEGVLLSALDKIPHTEPNLFAQIGAFYRDQKNYTKAIEYFEKALNSAGAASDPGIKKAIQNEIDYIRSKQ